MKILVDMDDTIEQLLKALVKRANERFHRNATLDDVTDWSIVCAYPGIEKQQILDFMREPDFWEDVEPVPGAAVRPRAADVRGATAAAEVAGEGGVCPRRARTSLAYRTFPATGATWPVARPHPPL